MRVGAVESQIMRLQGKLFTRVERKKLFISFNIFVIAFVYNWGSKSLYKILLWEKVPKSISTFHHKYNMY